MGFCWQAVPSVPVPDVAAVITVEQALGGGPVAHRVQLPRGVYDDRVCGCYGRFVSNRCTCHNCH